MIEFISGFIVGSVITAITIKLAIKFCFIIKSINRNIILKRK